MAVARDAVSPLIVTVPEPGPLLGAGVVNVADGPGLHLASSEAGNRLTSAGSHVYGPVGPPSPAVALF